MRTIPDINRYLRQHPRSCQYGAPMGASNLRPDDMARLYVQRIRFVDGDYAPDGTYWGGGSALWCAFSADYESARVYVRASSRADAIAKVREEYPDAALRFAGVAVKRAPIKFIRMPDPNLYGYHATVGKYKAEVVRAYAGEWHLFRFESGLMITGADPIRGYAATMTAARAWLASVQS